MYGLVHLALVGFGATVGLATASLVVGRRPWSLRLGYAALACLVVTILLTWKAGAL
jgi:hypothetical protein